MTARASARLFLCCAVAVFLCCLSLAATLCRRFLVPLPDVPASASDVTADDLLTALQTPRADLHRSDPRWWAEAFYLLLVAAQAESAGKHRQAALAFDDALELEPELVPALEGRQRSTAAADAVDAQMADDQHAAVNSSVLFEQHMWANVRSNQATLVSRDPPIYVLHGVVSRDEVAELLRLRDALAARWSAVPPVVCFEGTKLQSDGALQPYLHHGIGERGRRSCLNRTASAAAAAVIPFSEALSLRLGESELVDEVGRRLQAMAGLRDSHGVGFQLLEYSGGAAFHAHTDCHRRTLAQGTRMACRHRRARTSESQTAAPPLIAQLRPAANSGPHIPHRRL